MVRAQIGRGEASQAALIFGTMGPPQGKSERRGGSFIFKAVARCARARVRPVKRKAGGRNSTPGAGAVRSIPFPVREFARDWRRARHVGATRPARPWCVRPDGAARVFRGPGRRFRLQPVDRRLNNRGDRQTEIGAEPVYGCSASPGAGAQMGAEGGGRHRLGAAE